MYFMYNKLKFLHRKTQSVFFFKFLMIRLLSRHHPAANPSPPFPLCPAAGQRGRGGEGLAEAQLPHIFQDGVSPFAPVLTQEPQIRVTVNKRFHDCFSSGDFRLLFFRPQIFVWTFSVRPFFVLYFFSFMPCFVSHFRFVFFRQRFTPSVLFSSMHIFVCTLFRPFIVLSPFLFFTWFSFAQASVCTSHFFSHSSS